MSFVLKISIYATPGAKSTQVAGMQDHALRLRLAAPPVDGKANTALLAWAAKTFGVAKRQVELLHGAASRQKIIQITFSTETELHTAQALLADVQKTATSSKATS